MSLYKKTQFFANKKFNITIVKYCKAVVAISKDRIRFLIYNKNERKIEMFADYQILAENAEEFTMGLINLFDSYKVFDYFMSQKIRIVVETNKFSLIPSELFNENHIDSYLKFSFDINKYSLFSYVEENLKIAVPFAIREEIYEWHKHISEKHDSIVVPSPVPIIFNAKEYLEEKGLNAEEKILLYINKQKIHITIFYRNELIYYNIIDFDDEKILIAEILYILSALDIDRFTHQALVFGNLSKDNPIFKELKKYVKNVSLVPEKSFFGFGKYSYKNILAENLDLV